VRDLGKYLPAQTEEVVSGGAAGIDRCAREYAKMRRLRLTEFLPEYEKYGKAAPLRRNVEIVAYSDMVLAFWDGASCGTQMQTTPQNVPAHPKNHRI